MYIIRTFAASPGSTDTHENRSGRKPSGTIIVLVFKSTAVRLCCRRDATAVQSYRVVTNRHRNRRFQYFLVHLLYYILFFVHSSHVQVELSLYHDCTIVRGKLYRDLVTESSVFNTSIYRIVSKRVKYLGFFFLYSSPCSSSQCVPVGMRFSRRRNHLFCITFKSLDRGSSIAVLPGDLFYSSPSLVTCLLSFSQSI